MISFLSLPEELVSQIVCYLTVRDYTCLAWTSRKFYKDLQDPHSARKCLQRDLEFSKDGKDDFVVAKERGFRKRLSEIFKAKDALRTAQPFSISLLAQASSYVYESGLLCYSSMNAVRILNLRDSILNFRDTGVTEKVISPNFFSQKATEPTEAVSFPLPELVTVLSYGHNIVTVMCDFGSSKGCYLFAIDVTDGPDRKRCLVKVRLRSTEQLFACHNKDFVYYGTLSATGSSGFAEWLIQGHSLSTGQKVNQPIQLYNFAGSDIGSSVIFTIHNDHFMAISNQTSHETEEVNWTSYYHYITFRLDAADPKVKIKSFYRRQDNHGPINDAWTDLRTQIDHETGELLVIESRKEWLGGGSKCARTYYIQPYERACHKDWDEGNTVNPDDQVRLTVTEKDIARYEQPPHDRLGKYTHAEFSDRFNGDQKEYLRAKTKWNGYDFNNQCYIDFVVDEIGDEESRRKRERLRLRVVSRLPASPLMSKTFSPEAVRPQRYGIRPKTTDRDGKAVRDSEDVFTESDIFMWPRDGTVIPQELDDLLCPGGRAGDVQAQIGEEGIVLMTGRPDTNNERALVFLSFEPGWGWQGMRRLDGSLAVPRKKAQLQQFRLCVDLKRKAGLCDMSGEKDEDVKKRRGDVVVGAGLENVRDGIYSKTVHAGQEAEPKSTSALSLPFQESGTLAKTATVQNPKDKLLWREKPRYLSLSKGFWLR